MIMELVSIKEANRVGLYDMELVSIKEANLFKCTQERDSNASEKVHGWWLCTDAIM